MFTESLEAATNLSLKTIPSLSNLRQKFHFHQMAELLHKQNIGLPFLTSEQFKMIIYELFSPEVVNKSNLKLLLFSMVCEILFLNGFN